MAKARTNEGDPVIIKKYANRRLYNTDVSAYVTLEDLSAMVREGRDFVVHDAKSGEDITRSVLAQIIFEEEAKGQTMLPANFLRQLISLYGDSLQGVVPGYLETSMEAFTRNQDHLREQVSKAFGSNPALNSLETMARANMEMYENAMRLFTPFATRPESSAEKPAEKPSAPEEPAQSELNDLKDQLQQMQDQLSKLVKGS